jgi:repeat uncharacterized protein DUF346
MADDDIVIDASEMPEITDPALRAHADRIANAAILAMQKGIAQRADPAKYVISDPESFEQVFANFVTQLPVQIQEPVTAAGMSHVMADAATRQAAYRELAQVDLQSGQSVVDQVAAIPLPADTGDFAVGNLVPEVQPALEVMLVDGLTPQSVDSIVRFSIDQLRCDTPTAASYTLLGEHFDDIALAGVAVDCFGAVVKIVPSDLGHFLAGTVRPGPGVYAAFPIDNGSSWPKTFAVTTVLAETHLGDIYTVIDKLADYAKKYLTEVISAAVGALIGAEIGAAIGSIIPGFGTLIGLAVGAVVGYVIAKVINWIKGLFGLGGGDGGPGPMLSTLSNRLSVAGPGTLFGGSPKSSPAVVTLASLGGEYQLTKHWEIEWGSPIFNGCMHLWAAPAEAGEGGVLVAPNKGELPVGPLVGGGDGDAKWRSWESLGGLVNFDFAAAAWGPDRLDVFGVGPDSALYHRWWDGSWHAWELLGGKLTSGPAAVSWGPNRIDVVARGGDNAVWHKWFDGAWHNWESLGGQASSPPAIASWAPGRLDVFVAGTDKRLYHKYFDGGWHDWLSLGGSLTSGPAAVSWGPNRIDVVARGGDNAVWHIWWDSGWHAWESLGGEISYRPGASSWKPGRLDVFGVGGDRALYHKWFDESWHEWTGVGDVALSSGPAAVSWGPNRIDVLARGR